MSQHVPSDLLAAFVDGDVGEHVAVHIAQHIDDCPGCATKAASLEPLAPAFASMDDPPVPDDLADQIVRRLQAREGAPTLELLIGGGLMTAAALLAAATQHPLTALADPGALASASQAFLRSVAAGLGPFAYLATLAAAGSAFGGAMTLRLAPSPEV